MVNSRTFSAAHAEPYQQVRPYAAHKNFLTDYGSWLRAQNAGLDEWADGYGDDNNFIKARSLEDMSGLRHMSNMRDIACFVNKDALHQRPRRHALRRQGRRQR